MDISTIFNRRKKKWNQMIRTRKAGNVRRVICRNCQTESTEPELREKLWICPKCGAYLSMNPKERIHLIADQGTFQEMNRNLQTKDPLHFPEYPKKLETARNKTGIQDAVVTGICEIEKKKTAFAIFDSGFLMGSMGTVVGEKIARLTEYARKKKLPLIIYSASGGARMQEGLFSLMQMAKTAAAIQRFKDDGGLYLSVMTDPTTGGVSASFATIGDINIAEPGALICFAGPRVIEQTIGQTLPEGFQRAEFLEEHGMIDLILERKDQKKMLAKLLELHGY